MSQYFPREMSSNLFTLPYFPKEIIIQCPPISLHRIWIYVSKYICDIVREIGRGRREIEEGLKRKYFLNHFGIPIESKRDFSDILLMFEYWDEERGIQVFCDGDADSYLNVSQSVLSEWRDILLCYHWDEDFI